MYLDRDDLASSSLESKDLVLSEQVYELSVSSGPRRTESVASVAMSDCYDSGWSINYNERRNFESTAIDGRVVVYRATVDFLHKIQ